MDAGRKISCFTINLPEDYARRKNIENEFNDAGLPVVVVEAIHGNKLSPEQLLEVYDRKKASVHCKSLTVNEIGCALSHLSVYRKMVEDGISHALIVEDDARLTPALVPVIESLRDMIPADEPSVTLLTYVRYYSLRAVRRVAGDHILTRPATRHLWLAHGYFITLGAAKRMLQALYPVWLPADHWRMFEEMKMVKVRAVVPYCIGLSKLAQDSNLEMQRLARPKNPLRWKDFWQFRVREQFKKLAWPFLKIRRQNLIR